MKPDSLQTANKAGSRDNVGWPVAGLLLDALAQRDFDALSSCLATDVHFRGLIPRGPFDVVGPDDATAYFRRWFGGGDDFEVVDASIGQVGGKLYLRWRVRMQSPTGAARIAEQHVFATVSDRIDALDLVCSGFQAVAS